MLKVITKQLIKQNIDFKIINNTDKKAVEKAWLSAFGKGLNAPYLNQNKWHIFSYNQGVAIEGNDAYEKYNQQYPCDIIIFNEKVEYFLKISKSKLPQIKPDNFLDDIYICHRNMKWTFVLTHEMPYIGPFFCEK